MRNVKNIRLKDYDYATDGCYFVTICTDYKKPSLTGTNKIVVAQFIEQSLINPSNTEGIKIDYYQIMPTHLHMILIFRNSQLKLGEFIRRFKATTCHLLHKTNGSNNKLWQPNYYEHVIRNENALSKIREYIQNNPLVEEIKIEQFYNDKEPHK